MSNFNGEMFGFGESKKPFYNGKPASTFDKGRNRPAVNKGFGTLAPTFCSFRNRAGAKPGTPVYFGERPEGRPFANDLGQRNATESRENIGFGNTGRVPLDAATFFRSKVSGVKTFSWEQANEL